MFERVISLIGEDNLKKIQEKVVLVIGLGGVGGYAVEALARSGIQKFILIDYDTVDVTNLNRQIIATQDSFSLLKTDVMEKRILSIAPTVQVIKINKKIDLENIDDIFQYSFDYVIDACDTVVVKQEMIKRCLERKIAFISSMGTGNKLNPTELEITDIRKTSYDPIAKKIRKYLKEQKIYGKVPVVYSKEKREKFQGKIPSMIFVPATSGLLCANYVIKQILEEE